LQAGRTIRGLVLNANAKPVSGARLWAGRGEEPDARATSTPQGEFVLTPVTASSAITVMADGFELQQAEVESISAENHLTFRLKPSQPFRVQVVDETGAPVPRAEIVLENWPGSRRNSVEFREPTGADGRLVWLSAPPGPLEWCALKRGYRYTRSIELRADGTEHVITLHRALVVTGTVTDAETGAP